MQRITMSLDDDLVAEFDRWMASRGYSNRSEAMRDLLRSRMEEDRLARTPETPSVGILSYVFDHEVRTLADRLTKTQHDRHDLAVSTLHVHLAHETCLETAILRGPATALRALADQILAEPGVRHGHLHLVPVVEEEEAHGHGGEAARPHRHARPKT